MRWLDRAGRDCRAEVGMDKRVPGGYFILTLFLHQISAFLSKKKKKKEWGNEVFLWSVPWTRLRPSVHFTSITNQPLNTKAFILTIDLVCSWSRDLEMQTTLYPINRSLSYLIPYFSPFFLSFFFPLPIFSVEISPLWSMHLHWSGDQVYVTGIAQRSVTLRACDLLWEDWSNYC